MDRISIVGSKTTKKEKLVACSQRLIDLLKELQHEWQNSVPGLLIELNIHAIFLRRIQHQFRSSKIVHRSHSMQKCAGRLQGLRQLRFRDQLTCPGRTFADITKALLIQIGEIGQLLSQLTTYAQLVWEGTSQALAQEHYFFFGSDLSMLATTSRVWVLTKALLDSIRKFWDKIRKCLLESGLEKSKSKLWYDIFPGDILDQSPSLQMTSTLGVTSSKESPAATMNLLEEQEEKKSNKNSVVDGMVEAKNSCRKGLLKTSGALCRFS